jgi:hypothetical protein
MTQTHLEIDDDLLDLIEEARVSLGTRTREDTIAEALKRVVVEARARRADALADLPHMAAEGLFDFDRLDECDK